MSDAAYMAQALALAALGEGTTRPNPLVGCVVVNQGRVVGRGFHRAAGQPHAEAAALAEAGALSQGATLYVNLEPCAHRGRTGPCTDAIVGARVAHVVAAIGDPNPLVDGRGFAALRAAGIRVTTGVLVADARRLNAPFLSTHERRRPWVTLKAAQSLDGRIAAAGGRSRWITGDAARRYAHRLRFRHDAILVGAETIRRDDPSLTVRLPGVVAPRQAVILAPRLGLDPRARVFEREGGSRPLARIYVDEDCPPSEIARFEGVADVIRVGGDATGLSLRAVLSDLTAAGIQSVLVEGGGRTAGAFLGAGLVDEAALFIASRWIGAGGATPVIDVPAVDEPGRAWRLVDTAVVPVGRDVVVLGRPEAA
jgi:diaminohydroxyphosphoribosylaminopyrimidine deaminase/5-amino-6-(5-phosphoribosylamino)uracil reductase